MAHPAFIHSSLNIEATCSSETLTRSGLQGLTSLKTELLKLGAYKTWIFIEKVIKVIDP
jgi:hypothetical protein